ncbi:hypothetical protein DN051_36695 [Streptomyces cadmiisoli]|uniref:Uncharacterized protein n=1 Tax=Streptomyces cadmiisoli TaxID=2184053 RepID=A0A2Z4JCQ5_9ACTN|nr:hypothetical protein DN051_36695 [Streptomyces cadmiisoli]
MAGTTAAAVAAIVVVGVLVADDDGSSDAEPAPIVTITETETETETETVELTDQEIIDRSLEIIESAEADLDAGLVPDVTVPAADPAPTEEEEEPVGPSTSIGSGTYLVGEDVKAGSYKTSGPTDDMCYWARNKNDSGELEAIIANGILEGPGRVTLNKGEVFETSGCEVWELAK